MKNVNASEVRNYFRSTPSALASLSDSARETVREGNDVRGRIHPEARTAFNKVNRSRKYDEKVSVPTTVSVKVPSTNVKGVTSLRTREVPASQAREIAELAGLATPGARGRLSADALAQVGAALV